MRNLSQIPLCEALFCVIWYHLLIINSEIDWTTKATTKSNNVATIKSQRQIISIDLHCESWTSLKLNGFSYIWNDSIKRINSRLIYTFLLNSIFIRFIEYLHERQKRDLFIFVTKREKKCEQKAKQEISYTVVTTCSDCRFQFSWFVFGVAFVDQFTLSVCFQCIYYYITCVEHIKR